MCGGKGEPALVLRAASGDVEKEVACVVNKLSLMKGKRLLAKKNWH
jgi:hypothetical protein